MAQTRRGKMFVDYGVEIDHMPPQRVLRTFGAAPCCMCTSTIWGNCICYVLQRRVQHGSLLAASFLEDMFYF